MVTTPVNPTVEGQSVLSTLNEDGTRRWLRPRQSKGRFLTARRIVAWALIAIFTVTPFIKIAGKPLFLFDIPARRFTFFGYTFLPTDTVLFALFMVGLFVTVFLVTALFGRVWCGWACPQTVYMEFVYRPIERLFDGASGRSNKGPLGKLPPAKPLRFAVYLVVSWFLANTFLAWFVGVDRLGEWITSSPFEHPTGFVIMAIVTGLMMFDFGYFREQVCIVACPYGRMQSVMLDRDSMIVTYDKNRGEPRGKKRKSGPDAALGDCVDCHMCVSTCPTGIDIRNGLQMECIGCAQCIDACDSVMTKLGRDTGLIRYSSQSVIDKQSRRFLRPRIVLYPLILVALSSVFVFLLVNKSTTDVILLRGIGRPYMELENKMISNPVRVKIVNRTDVGAEYTIGSLTEGVTVHSERTTLAVGGGATETVPAEVVAPLSMFSRGGLDVVILIENGAGFREEREYHMVGPAGAGRPSGGGGE